MSPTSYQTAPPRSEDRKVFERRQRFNPALLALRGQAQRAIRYYIGLRTLVLHRGRVDDDKTLHVDDRGSAVCAAHGWCRPGGRYAGVAGADGGRPRADAGQVPRPGRSVSRRHVGLGANGGCALGAGRHGPHGGRRPHLPRHVGSGSSDGCRLGFRRRDRPSDRHVEGRRHRGDRARVELHDRLVPEHDGGRSWRRRRVVRTSDRTQPASSATRSRTCTST